MKSAKEILGGMPLYKQLLKREELMNQQNQIQKTMNATIVTGEYTDRQSGQRRKSYLTIGKLFIYSNGGMSLKLDALPLHGQNIVFYPPKPKPQNQQANQNYNSGGNNQPPPQNNNYNGNNNQNYNNRYR